MIVYRSRSISHLRYTIKDICKSRSGVWMKHITISSSFSLSFQFWWIKWYISINNNVSCVSKCCTEKISKPQDTWLYSPPPLQCNYNFVCFVTDLIYKLAYRVSHKSVQISKTHTKMNQLSHRNAAVCIIRLGIFVFICEPSGAAAERLRKW